MPRRQKTDQEKQLEQQVAALIRNIKQSDEPRVDVARALALFERAAKYQAQGLAILRGEEIEQPEPAPGKNRVGRPRKEADLFDSAPADESKGEDASPSVTKKKGARTGARIA